MAHCGAKTRSGGTCKQPAMPNGRCRLHGGKSTGAPKGNQNATKWGLLSKYITPEQVEIMRTFDESNPADILWANILIAYSAIIRAQNLMYVKDKDDHTKILSSDSENSTTWSIYTSFNKHANFMQAQARAQAELRQMIKEFMAVADESDARKLKLQVMQKDVEIKGLEIQKLRNPSGIEVDSDDGFIDALNASASEVWDDKDG